MTKSEAKKAHVAAYKAFRAAQQAYAAAPDDDFEREQAAYRAAYETERAARRAARDTQ